MCNGCSSCDQLINRLQKDFQPWMEWLSTASKAQEEGALNPLSKPPRPLFERDSYPKAAVYTP